MVVDLALLGPQAWDYLEKLSADLPGLGVVVCTGPLLGRPARARAAAGGRRLGDEALPPRGGHRAGRGGRAAAPRGGRRGRVGAGRSPARWRSAPTSTRPTCGSASVDLTRREFELIQLLAGAQGRVLEREEIYQRVWGYAMARGDRSVDVFVRKLRQKLEKASPSWRYIHTHFGVGYRFAAEPAEGPLEAAGAEVIAAARADLEAASRREGPRPEAPRGRLPRTRGPLAPFRPPVVG